MNEMYLPEKLREILGDEPFTLDEVGMSGAKILLFADKVLKIRPEREDTERELLMMQWMEGKVPGPKCLFHAVEDGNDYLLMTRVQGKMSCSPEFMENPHQLVEALADALRQLWQVDVTDCPLDSGLDYWLEAAERAVVEGRVDVDDVEPETFGEGGFESPAHLLQWLKDNRPEIDPVLSHGDFCLPNIFLDEEGKLSGFIDLGGAGVSDRWQDIALCYRSLLYNYSGHYGGKVYEGFDPEILFDALGLTPDREKLRYYRLLDELF